MARNNTKGNSMNLKEIPLEELNKRTDMLAVIYAGEYAEQQAAMFDEYKAEWNRRNEPQVEKRDYMDSRRRGSRDIAPVSA
jgi:hypothetical protein